MRQKYIIFKYTNLMNRHKTHYMHYITKTHPCDIQRFFTAVKMTIFNCFFTIFIFLLKVGCKGVYITRTCLHDDE